MLVLVNSSSPFFHGAVVNMASEGTVLGLGWWSVWVTFTQALCLYQLRGVSFFFYIIFCCELGVLAVVVAPAGVVGVGGLDGARAELFHGAFSWRL